VKADWKSAATISEFISSLNSNCCLIVVNNDFAELFFA